MGETGGGKSRKSFFPTIFFLFSVSLAEAAPQFTHWLTTERYIPFSPSIVILLAKPYGHTMYVLSLYAVAVLLAHNSISL